VFDGKYSVKNDDNDDVDVNLSLFDVPVPGESVTLHLAFEMRKENFPATGKKVHRAKKCGFVKHNNVKYHVLFHQDGVLSANAGE
jgi:hypothetical protein